MSFVQSWLPGIQSNSSLLTPPTPFYKWRLQGKKSCCVNGTPVTEPRFQDFHSIPLMSAHIVRSRLHNKIIFSTKRKINSLRLFSLSFVSNILFPLCTSSPKEVFSRKVSLYKFQVPIKKNFLPLAGLMKSNCCHPQTNGFNSSKLSGWGFPSMTTSFSEGFPRGICSATWKADN